MDGEFCKHLVAVGLKWLDEKNSGRFKDSDDQKVTSLSLRDWLLKQSKDRLIEMIVDQAGVDDEFYNFLEMQASISTDNRIDMKRLKKSLRAVISIEDDLDYDKYYDYYAQVQKAVDNLKELLKQGYAAEMLELTEYALAKLEKAIYCIYDSDWDIEYIVSELTDLHCNACKKIKPDVKELAKLLYEWELNPDRYVYSGVVEKYFEILGDTGLDEYRRLIELAWADIPALKPGDKVTINSYRSRITSIMENLARHQGDIDAWVEIKKRDLSQPYHFLQIAEIYLKAKRVDDAITWAELGLEAFPDLSDSRIVDLLAQLYPKKKMHDKVIPLVWKSFEKSPQLERFLALKKYAKKAGNWPEWQNRAISLIRKNLEAQKFGAKKNSFRLALIDYSLLVQIFLEENDIESAWREALSGGCSNDLWLKIAHKREKDHPADAIKIYKQQVERLINVTKDEAYREAIDLIKKIRVLMLGSDGKDAFEYYLFNVRSTYKRKRNLIKFLDSKKWL